MLKKVLIPLFLLLNFIMLQTVNAVGGSCLICTLIFGLLEEISITQQLDGSQTLSLFCTSITSNNKDFQPFCQKVGEVYGQNLTTIVKNDFSPDLVCLGLKACPGTGECVLFEDWPPAHTDDVSKPIKKYLGPKDMSEVQRSLLSTDNNLFSNIDAFKTSLDTLLDETLYGDIISTNGLYDNDDVNGGIWDIIKKLFQNLTDAEIDRVFNKHYPLIDRDKDNFSHQMGKFRGYNWRGKDCDDKNAKIYPGTLVHEEDREVDSNCNGIFGIDNTTNDAYERLYCDNTGQRGLIILGDSATAHFSLPPRWLTAKTFNNDTFANALDILADEIDYPACSWGTGWWNPDKCPEFNEQQAPYKPLVQRFHERNRCNFRDFQNIGVNGASTQNVNPNVKEGNIYSIQRNATTDAPALLIHSLIGNDVCTSHPGTAAMTTVEQFEKNVIANMEYLDSGVLPKGSHVLFIALVDGRILYDAMANETHPLLVSYSKVYDYLTCSGENPCSGWLTTNSTLRDETSKRAAELSAVYQKIIKEQKYKNFDMLYFNPDWVTLMKEWVNAGNKAADLIEKSDGFHPNQNGNNLLSDAIWKFLEENHPEALGDVNPHNDKIKEIFGDQGGY